MAIDRALDQRMLMADPRDNGAGGFGAGLRTSRRPPGPWQGTPHLESPPLTNTWGWRWSGGAVALVVGDVARTDSRLPTARGPQAAMQRTGAPTQKSKSKLVLVDGLNPSPPCDIPSGCCSFTGPWTVTRSSLRMLRRVAAFYRPLRPVLFLTTTYY